MRKWRKEQPIKAAWAIHKWNAKKRGILVLWDYYEFRLFCSWTGYHLIKGETVIDRIDFQKGYSLENCRLLDRDWNSFRGTFIEKKLKRLAFLKSLRSI